MFLSLDGTFWVQLVNFAIFFAILNVVFLRPVGDAIKKRREHIDGIKSDAERSAGEIGKFRSEAEAQRAAARREAEERVVKARSAADAQAASEVAAATDRAQAIIDDAREKVGSEMQAARSRGDELSQSLARTLLERAIGVGR